MYIKKNRFKGFEQTTKSSFYYCFTLYLHLFNGIYLSVPVALCSLTPQQKDGSVNQTSAFFWLPLPHFYSSPLLSPLCHMPLISLPFASRYTLSSSSWYILPTRFSLCLCFSHLAALFFLLFRPAFIPPLCRQNKEASSLLSAPLITANKTPLRLTPSPVWSSTD